MVYSARQASIAAVFYVGDGIVVKVTEPSYLPEELRSTAFPGAATHLSGVIPPIHSEDVAGYKVEIFPWIDHTRIGDQQVEEMAATLASYNLKFKSGDGRADNVGRLPDGTLAVLDGNAVEVLDRTKNVTGMHQWHSKILQQFGPLYTEHSGHEAGKKATLLKPEHERGADYYKEQFSSLRAVEKSHVRDAAASKRKGWTLWE